MVVHKNKTFRVIRLSKKTMSELDNLSLAQVRKLTDLFGIGVSFNEPEKKIKDLKGEIIFVITVCESEYKIKKGLKKLKDKK